MNVELKARNPRIHEHVRDYSLSMQDTFSTKVHGKCILTGEHAVLRGVPALVVPLRSRVFELAYIPSVNSTETSLKIESRDEASEPTKLVLWGVLERALSHVGKNFQDLIGVIKIKNDVPFGAGLGASAALCVSVARLFRFLGWIDTDAVVEFARTLENIFHGESSGVDVAVAEMDRPIQFTRGHGIVDLDIKWRPELYLSFSGRKGVTSECVKMVQNLIKEDVVLGAKIDEQMSLSVLLMQKSLIAENLTETERQELFILSLNTALECFEKWNLTKGFLAEHIKVLRSHGVLACKPTGSGGGGHVLSFWQGAPPTIDGFEFFKLEI